MLIDSNKQPKAGDVVAFRLVSGDELVARVFEITTNHVTVTKPIAVQMTPVGDGEMGLGFVPWMITATPEAKFRFDLDRLLAMPIAARPDVATQYQQMTSSILPPNSGR